MDTLKVLAAAPGRGVRMVTADGAIVAYSRITTEGRVDDRSGHLIPGPVEVPACGHYRQLIREGTLVEARPAAMRRRDKE